MLRAYFKVGKGRIDSTIGIKRLILNTLYAQKQIVHVTRGIHLTIKTL